MCNRMREPGQAGPALRAGRGPLGERALPWAILMIAGALVTAGWSAMESTVPTEVTPTVDGKVSEGEYEAWARGINKSFGDRIGMKSKLYMRSTMDGSFYIGLRSVNGFPDNEADGAVMY